jgi:putative transcriptional regulator
MTKKKIKELCEEAKAVEKGQVAPGRVWRVTKRPDGTYERIQEDPEAYRLERAAKSQEEPFALKVRRKLGVSQDRFAKLLGISAATVRNWEQGRRQPTGAAKVLLRVAVKNPKAILAAAA